MDDLERALAKTWFYPFTLPDGRVTPSYDGGVLDPIHHTRLAMLDDALARAFPQGLSGRRALDLACHQGWFAVQLAARGAREVVALDARAEHIADVELITRVLGRPEIRAVHADVHQAPLLGLGGFDLVLCFGLLYHLENPVGALRAARALCTDTLVIETQLAPNLSGPLDYGSYRFVKPMVGSFAIVDETEETHGPEASTTGICLVPSFEALCWVLTKLGCTDITRIPCPEGGYEQLRYGKRAVVLARVSRPGP